MKHRKSIIRAGVVLSRAYAAFFPPFSRHLIFLTVLCFAFLVSSRPAHATVTNVAWYRLGENDPGAASGQVANSTTVDAIGVNHLKRFGTARYTNDVPSGAASHMLSSLAVSFNAASYYSNEVATTARNNFGLEAWVELDSAIAGTNIIAFNGNILANGWGIQAVIGTHSILFRGVLGGGIVFGGRTAGTTAHVALVRDNGICTLYVNGVASGSTNVTPATPSTSFSVAAIPQVPQFGIFPGTIDEVRVFTFAAGQFSTDDLQYNQQLISTLDATGVTRSDAVLHGAASSFALPTTVWFEYGTSPALGTATPGQDLGSGFTSTNFSQAISGLSIGDTYFFCAVVSNQLGVTRGSLNSFMTTGFLEGGGFALKFDGTNDYASIGDDFLLNYRELVITAWINTTQTNGEVGLINKYVAGSSNGWHVGLLNGELRAWYIADASSYVWDGASGLNGGPVADGQWHHIAFTIADTSGGSLYVDGQFKDFLSWVGPIKSCTTTQELGLGRYPGGNGEFFRGMMDEVAIWSAVELTQGEIQTNMNRGLIGRESGLIAYYRLNSGSGTFVNDDSPVEGNSFATLNNGVAWVQGISLRPGVMSKTATAVTSTSALLNAVANPGLTNTAGWFEWGTTTAYGNSTPAQMLGNGGENTNFNQSIGGLTDGTLYHYRAVASNSLGASLGLDLSFVATGTNMLSPRANHTATLLPNGKVLVVGGADENQPLSSTELYDPALGKWTLSNPMPNERSQHTATFLPNGKVLIAGGQGIYPTLYASALLYDPATGVWSPTGPMATNRYAHTATLLPNGKVLVSGGLNSGGKPLSCELYDPLTGLWTSTGSLAQGRQFHTATLLRNGKVLITGGLGTNNTLSSSELFDPALGTWSSTGAMKTNRYAHTATLLTDGQVLVVGGVNFSPFTYFNTAELYDPLSGTWTNTGAMLNYRAFHTATLLPNGYVLAAGYGIGVPSLYNPQTRTWTDVPGPDPAGFATATLLPNGNVLVAGGTYGFPKADAALYVTTNNPARTNTTPMAYSRYSHTATLLPGGQVLVASFTNSELYNPIAGTWSNTAALNTSRSGHTATMLPNGKVLATGGFDLTLAVLRSAELFDSSTGSWTNTGSMTTNRVGHTATLLLNGKVLVAGGYGGTFTPAVATAELFEPLTGKWTATGSMSANRSGHTATLLPNGNMLVTGGTPDNSSFFASLNSAEIFDPLTGTWTTISPMQDSRAGHRAILLPNGSVLVAGGVAGGLDPANTSAEIFDPATLSWKSASPMATGRQGPTMNLFPNGQVLVTGGYNLGYLASSEFYDPFTGQWHAAPSMNTARSSHTGTLLPNGKVLVAGGWTGNSATNVAELFDASQGFSNSWRSVLTSISSPIPFGGSITITGAQFRGVSGASFGTGQDSSTDFPVLQLHSVEGDWISYRTCQSWSSNSFISLPVNDFPSGLAIATIFTHGIPGTGALCLLQVPPPPAPVLVTQPFSGEFRLNFTNVPGTPFTVLSATNPALPLSNWTVMGPATEVAPGQFQFGDPQSSVLDQRYYRVRWP
jgi:hypothetical protein